MVQVKIGNNMKRATVVIDENTTLRRVLEDNGIDYGVGVTTLDGSPLVRGELDKTFAQLGITEKATLLNVVKADNAGQ